MGKFKEIDIERKMNGQKGDRRVIDMLSIQYPFMHYHIQQAFDFGDEEKVFELIFNLEPKRLPC